MKHLLRRIFPLLMVLCLTVLCTSCNPPTKIPEQDLLGSIGQAEDGSFTFRNLQWGTPIKEIIQKDSPYKEKAFHEPTMYGQYVSKDPIMLRNPTAVGYMHYAPISPDDPRLAEGSFAYSPLDIEDHTLYQKLKEEFMRRYGEPTFKTLTSTTWEKRYQKDGDEMSSVLYIELVPAPVSPGLANPADTITVLVHGPTLARDSVAETYHPEE